jgi:hypothetical protein
LNSEELASVIVDRLVQTAGGTAEWNVEDVYEFE